MVSQLESQIRKAVADGFRGQLLPGTLLREAPTGSNDEYGDPEFGEPSSHTFEGMVDTYSQFYSAQAGIPDTDVRVLIIAGSLDITPIKTDKVKIRDKWYQIREIRTDPALATWECQSFEIADPTA